MAGIDLDQGVFKFYAFMIVLIAIIGGAAYYLLMKAQNQRNIFSQDDGRISDRADGRPGNKASFS